MKASRTDLVPLLVLSSLLAVFATIHFSQLDRGQDWGDDFAAYIMQARSLATGSVAATYDRLAFFFDHSTFIIAPAIYPWGFPILLTPVYALFGVNVLAFKGVVLLFLVGTLAVVFLLYHHGLTTLQSALAVTILAISPTFLHAGTRILSDIPFAFFCLSTLLLIQYCVIGRRTVGPAWFSAVLLGLTLFAAYFTRSIGFVLLPTLFAAQLFAAAKLRPEIRFKAERWLIDAIPYAVFLAGLAISRLALPSPTLELKYFSLASSRVAASVSKGVPYYFDTLGSFFTNCPPSVAIVATMFAVLGMCVRFREDWILLLFGALYLGVLIISPFYGGIRYLYPVLPLFIYFAFIGARFLSSAAAGPWAVEYPSTMLSPLP